MSTETRTATFTIAKRHGTVTVVSTPEGWEISGKSKRWTNPTEFTGEIKRCECDPEHPDAETYKGKRREPCTCHVASHIGGRFCHGWHVDRVRKLAEQVARTYT